MKRQKKKLRSVWMVTREYGGVAGAGGVKDVSRELSESLGRAGYEIRAFLPCYGFIHPAERGFRRSPLQFEVDMDYAHEERRETVSFWRKKIDGVELVLVDAERFTEKSATYTYTEADQTLDPAHRKGTGHYDYFAMNVLLQKSVLNFALAADRRPDIFHCHDGHTALLPVMMKERDGFRQYFRKTGGLITIHNAGIGYHQDVADLPFARAVTGLPWRLIYSSLLNGSFDPFLAGSGYSLVNTVSENYAVELQQTELDALTGWLGHALGDRGVRLEGITNGIEPANFDPRYPEKLGIPAAFDPQSGEMDGKTQCRKKLCSVLRAEAGEGIRYSGSLEYREGQPLLTAVNRLTEQKGSDIFIPALEALLSEDENFQVAIMGSGDQDKEKQLASLAGHPAYKGRIAVMLGYQPELANLVFAAGDFLVIPSRYEPCGLTDFIAQLMGNIPIVRATGGLIKVRDGFNGFSFSEHTPVALANSMKRAIRVYRDHPDRLKKMIVDANAWIRENFTWDKVRGKYVKLYEKAAETAGRL